jgi:hypothetical protein
MKLFIFSLLLICPLLVLSQDIPYKVAKKVDNLFYHMIKDMKIAEQEIIQNNGFESKMILYFDNDEQSQFTNSVNKTIIQIDGYYFSFGYGIDPGVAIYDLAGNDKNMEIVYNVGVDDSGNYDEYIIRIFKDMPFSVTFLGSNYFAANKGKDIDISKPYNDANGDYETYDFKADLDRLRNIGEFVVYTIFARCDFHKYYGPCCATLQSYKISGKGFKKSTYFKKVQTDCVG